ncbi:hypothetical protein B0H19DRAFT_653670 [Mycena capillaripes]|nr:hypothetical protein B0H19DRAFT_653670 [Mycena capillaripes]
MKLPGLSPQFFVWTSTSVATLLRPSPSAFVAETHLLFRLPAQVRRISFLDLHIFRFPFKRAIDKAMILYVRFRTLRLAHRPCSARLAHNFARSCRGWVQSHLIFFGEICGDAGLCDAYAAHNPSRVQCCIDTLLLFIYPVAGIAIYVAQDSLAVRVAITATVNERRPSFEARSSHLLFSERVRDTTTFLISPSPSNAIASPLQGCLL